MLAICRKGLLAGVVFGVAVFAWGISAGFGDEGMPSAAEVDSLTARAMGSANSDSLLLAVRALEQVARHHPDSARVSLRIGQLYARLRRSDQAIRAFSQAVAADPGLFEAHLGLGLAFLDLKDDWRNALPSFQLAVALDTNRVESLYHLARGYVRGGREEARKIAARAIRVDPAYAPPFLLLAQAYEEEQHEDMALFYYQEYLDRGGKEEEGAFRFARRLADRGRERKAERLLARMRDPRSYTLLSQILANRGDYEGALLAFEEYIGSLREEEQELYRDISLVAGPLEGAAYRRTPPEDRREFLRRFWLERDPFLATGGLMRWLEHYRRVLYARERFAGSQYPWDRRGEVYIRYGEPDYRSAWGEITPKVPQAVQTIQTELARSLYGPDAVAHTFWGPVYPVRTDRSVGAAPEGPEMADVPQGPHEGSALSRLGASPSDTLGFSSYKPVTQGLMSSTVKWETWVYTKVGGGIEIVFTDEVGKGKFDYAPIPILSAEDLKRLKERDPTEVVRVRRLLYEYAPETRMRGVIQALPEAYDPGDFEGIDFHFDALDLRGPGGQTEVRVCLGIPIRNLQVSEAGEVATVNRRVALVESRSKQVHQACGDIQVSLAGAEKSVLLEEFPFTVAPSDYRLAIQVWRLGTKRMGVYHQPLAVESYAGDSLMVSDLQVARRVAPADSSQTGPALRSNFRVTPAPGRIFYKGDHVFLYFEVYNLTMDTLGQTHYEVTYTVSDASRSPLLIRAISGLAGRGGEGAVTAHFEQKGTAESVPSYVELQIENAGVGENLIHLAVKDLNSGARVSKTASFRFVANPNLTSEP
ncbi:MAG: hypothetical protein A3F84_19780 [Candidatus Handelsmanbacteria bacterium RIFCSPLOWO2_12_FULL_64_10]|uniref:Uncharacterized protein n=1 Tax=Handelsmanbacteria sp. (strain RIFCSPLOWO2_12_FULL_64_10) TaxID=1817868 RepID=A0A1F6CSG6_HANXR|nr:MAG: hypothetical protein A3F84_19780 [Candidatus Handelsmanbacteria bacterium RIFCSPLOWO2_12_FULL_64_10]